MSQNKLLWPILLDKFIKDDFTDLALQELLSQMLASSTKRRQFLERTHPEHVRRALKEAYYFDSEKSWKNLQESLPFLRIKPYWYQAPARWLRRQNENNGAMGENK